jgi:hypothetical protein
MVVVYRYGIVGTGGLDVWKRSWRGWVEGKRVINVSLRSYVSQSRLEPEGIRPPIPTNILRSQHTYYKSHPTFDTSPPSKWHRNTFYITLLIQWKSITWYSCRNLNMNTQIIFFFFLSFIIKVGENPLAKNWTRANNLNTIIGSS